MLEPVEALSPIVRSSPSAARFCVTTLGRRNLERLGRHLAGSQSLGRPVPDESPDARRAAAVLTSASNLRVLSLEANVSRRLAAT
jgi:hypothetical protein